MKKLLGLIVPILLIGFAIGKFKLFIKVFCAVIGIIWIISILYTYCNNEPDKVDNGMEVENTKLINIRKLHNIHK